MKTLIITNEPFAEMLLGKNTTLAYVLAAYEYGDSYVWNFAENICVNIDENQAKILIKEYKRINLQVRNFRVDTENVKVGDMIDEIFVDVPEFGAKDLIIQRLEPMKAPFPPDGNRDINDVLRDFRLKFPQNIFNCPIGMQDKELEKFGEIVTPTKEFRLDDENYAQAVDLMGKKYEEIYHNNKRKVVIKPKDLAQSMGVFSLDLSENKDVKQACLEEGEEFYRDQILVQPFLEGVKDGDIRMSIIKNAQGDFECAGYTFRKSLRSSEDEDFTTGYISGGSIPRPISELSKIEQSELLRQSEKILSVLNGELREKYHNSIELGVDFLLVGNGRDMFLGEINHHCSGLMPISEAMGDEEQYQGGLGIVKKVIEVSLSKIT